MTESANTQELNISKPGRSKSLISPSEALRRNPDFFKDRKPQEANWILRVKHLDGRTEEMPPGTDWEAISKWGAVRTAVVTKPDGTPDFDRPRYDESPGVVVVAWGRDGKTGKIKVAMISQARPHADNSFDKSSVENMVFEQTPMGFLDKMVGEDQLEKFESLEDGAKREAGEEAGVIAIKDISYPEYSEQYNSPSFIGTSNSLAFVEVDLDKVDVLKIDRKEQIYQAEYIYLDRLIDNIKKGKTEMGYARLGTSNSAILIFLSNLSSFRNAERNEKILSTEGKANRKFKKEDPAGYLQHRLRVSKVRRPENFDANKRKAEKYLENLTTKAK